MSYSKEAVMTETPEPTRVDTRGSLSLVTMFVSLAAITISLLGAAKLVADVFSDGLGANLEGITVKIFVLTLSFLFGWVVGLVSIRLFGNMFYPLVVQVYAWGSVLGTGVVYIKVIQKLFGQKYDLLHFFAYMVILLGSLTALIFLHLLVEGHDLRPFAIPLLILSVVQLIAIVIRYVFTDNPNGWMLFGDIAIFGLMVSISALMLMHLGILAPLRDQINGWFYRTVYQPGTDEME